MSEGSGFLALGGFWKRPGFPEIQFHFRRAVNQPLSTSRVPVVGMEDGADEMREITIEMDEWTAKRLKELAWEHDTTTEEVAKKSCRYGVREYEQAGIT